MHTYFHRLSAPLFLACLAVFPLLPAAEAYAQPARASVNQEVPVAITSDKMNYEPEKNRVVFSGNVQVERQEFLMWSELLTLHLKPKNGAAQPAADPAVEDREDGEAAPAASPSPALNPGDLDRIVAEKNVRFKYGTQTGTAAKATYTMASSVLLLEGSPHLQDGENSITGNRIRYYLDENRSEVLSSGKERVHAIFAPRQESR